MELTSTYKHAPHTSFRFPPLLKQQQQQQQQLQETANHSKTGRKQPFRSHNGQARRQRSISVIILGHVVRSFAVRVLVQREVLR